MNITGARSYKSTEGFANGMAILLVLIVAAVVTLLATHLDYFLYTSSVRDLVSLHTQESVRAFDMDQLLSSHAFHISRAAFWLSLCTSLLMVALLFIWVYRSRENLEAFGMQGLIFTSPLAVLSFVIPLANLILPPLVIAEIWRASEPARAGVEHRGKMRPVLLITLWWLSTLTAIGSGLYFQWRPRPGFGIGYLKFYFQWPLITGVLNIVWIALTTSVVHKVSSMQAERHSGVSVTDHPVYSSGALHPTLLNLVILVILVSLPLLMYTAKTYIAMGSYLEGRGVPLVFLTYWVYGGIHRELQAFRPVVLGLDIVFLYLVSSLIGSAVSSLRYLLKKGDTPVRASLHNGNGGTR